MNTLRMWMALSILLIPMGLLTIWLVVAVASILHQHMTGHAHCVPRGLNNEPICSYCRYAKRIRGNPELVCTHQLLSRDPIDGSRVYAECRAERSGGSCGMDGRFYEP